jgi:hypothetical protein
MSSEAANLPQVRGIEGSRSRDITYYRLGPKGEEYSRHLKAVEALRASIYPRQTASVPRVATYWNWFRNGALAVSVLVAAPLLWFGIFDRSLLSSVPWFLTVGMLALLLVLLFAVVAMLITAKERNAFDSLFYVLDQKRVEAGYLTRKLLQAETGGRQFHSLQEVVMAHLKDGNVNFDARRRLWTSINEKKDLQELFANSTKET